MKRVSHRRGFSRWEILAIGTVLIIVAAVFIPHSWLAFETSRGRADNQTRNIINLEVARWHLNKGAWPADDLSDIGADQKYFPRGLPASPYEDEVYSLNSTTHRVQSQPVRKAQ